MNRLLNKLKSGKMGLIVSIPQNKYEFAKAAWENGADAIKVHINVWHRASKNTFGTLEDNMEVFTRILKDSPVPVGIVVGEDTYVAEEQIEKVIKMGFDFVSLYGHHTPPTLINNDKINNFFAVNYTYPFEEIIAIGNSGFADFLELSICNPESYGERLNARDICRYKYLTSQVNIPTVVPTQHKVVASDIPVLAKTGISAIMIGAIAFGQDVDEIARVCKEFRTEIDKL